MGSEVTANVLYLNMRDLLTNETRTVQEVFRAYVEGNEPPSIMTANTEQYLQALQDRLGRAVRFEDITVTAGDRAMVARINRCPDTSPSNPTQMGYSFTLNCDCPEVILGMPSYLANNTAITTSIKNQVYKSYY